MLVVLALQRADHADVIHEIPQLREEIAHHGAALAAGAELINDVTGLEGDPEMIGVALETGAGVCAMHMQGTPQTMQDDPQYENVIEEISEYLAARRNSLVAAGIAPERICLDPGIGFGKRSAENLAILRNLTLFHGFGCRTLLGASRKGFGAKTQALAPRDRLPTSLAAAVSAAAQGFRMLRVHDVAETKLALEIWRRITEN
ncbi:MAG: dihydropteroate synthase, partial [Brachymonas sp.]|nr:dihydropteroate synthase [Brachymonas sp.]